MKVKTFYDDDVMKTVEETVYKAVTLTPLNGAEMLALLKKVEKRVKEIPLYHVKV